MRTSIPIPSDIVGEIIPFGTHECGCGFRGTEEQVDEHIDAVHHDEQMIEVARALRAAEVAGVLELTRAPTSRPT